jgi:hypothetical protein
MEIELLLRDQASGKLNKVKGQINNFSQSAMSNFVNLASQVYLVEKAFTALSTAVKSVGSSLIDAGRKVENLRVRLRVLTGSLVEGNKVFADMEKLAGKVPKTYDEILEAATDLMGVWKGGREGLNQLMSIIVDISASTGMTVREVTSQIIRMYSAGASAAEMFKEKGVSEALGFQFGVSYTNKETMDILTKQWEKGFGKFVGASKLLAETFDGVMSMVQDAWFQFKVALGEDIFEKIKVDLQAFIKLIREAKKEGGKLEGVIENLSSTFVDLYETSKQAAATILVATGQTIDIFNELVVVIMGAKGAWQSFIAGVFKTVDAIKSLPKPFEGIFMFVDAEDNKAALDEVLKDIEITTEQIKDAREKADLDYSEKFKVHLEEIKVIYDEFKSEILEKQKDASEELAEGAKPALKGLSDEAKKGIKELEKMVGQIESGLSSNLSDLIRGAKTAKEAFAAMGEAMLKAITDFIAQQIIAHTIGAAIRSALSLALAAMGTEIAAAFAPAAAMVSLASFGANAAPAQAGIISTAAVAQAAAIPKLAEGGVVNRPTVALIGEAGPEAVVPLSRGGSSFGDINVIINNPVVEEDNISDLAEQLGIEIERQLRYSRSI